VRARPVPLWGASSFLEDAWYAVVFKGVFLLAVPWALFRSRGHRLPELLYGWRPTPSALAAVGLAFAVGLSLNPGYVPEIRAAAPAFPAWEATGRIALGALLALATAGFPEEFVYRGILQTRLERALGRAPAIALTVVLFTAWHLPARYVLSRGVEGTAGDWGSVLLGTGVPVAFVGLVFGLAWDRWRNLPALVAAHWAIDLLPKVASLLKIPPH